MLDGLVSCSLDCSLSCTSVSHTLLAQLKNVSVFVFNIAILFRSFGIQFWKTLRWLEVVLCNLIFDISRLNDFPHFIHNNFPFCYWLIYSLLTLHMLKHTLLSTKGENVAFLVINNNLFQFTNNKPINNRWQLSPHSRFYRKIVFF